jgi:hypothetical protein
MLVIPQVSIAPASIENSSGVIRNRDAEQVIGESTFFGRIGVPRCRVAHLCASSFLSRLTASGLSISAFYLRLRFLHNVATATTAPVASAKSATVFVLTPTLGALDNLDALADALEDGMATFKYPYRVSSERFRWRLMLYWNASKS